MTYPLKPRLNQVYASLAPDGCEPVPSPGDEVFEPVAGKWFKFVKNNHSAALAVGDVVAWDLANGTGYEVKRPATATLNLMAGIAVGAIPISGYGWIQTYGQHDTALLEGTTNIAIGDSLKAVDAQLYAVKDQATGTEATYARHLIALEAFETNATGSKKVLIRCR